MIISNEFLNFLIKKKVKFFTGVPDSVLKNFLEEISKLGKKNHVETFNEGSAVSLAIGYNLATKKIPCVYFQNSGLGNAINPLVSIAHPKVYSVPLLLLIGWRGSPFMKSDEPQHNVKGKITRDILKLLAIKFLIIRTKKDFSKISKLLDFAKKNSRPIALLVENNILKSKLELKDKKIFKVGVKREAVIQELLKKIKKGTKLISTTGYTSRELFQIRKNKNFKIGKDFYMVGGMGHSLMVSLGYSMNKNNETICLDGDGALLMHLGSLRTSGIFGKKNLKHIVFNNFCHESVGAQRTFAENMSFSKLAKDLGYKNFFKIYSEKDIKVVLTKFLRSNGPSLLEIITKVGTLKDLKRPKDFMGIKMRFIK